MRKINLLEYKENLLARMYENSGSMCLTCDKLPDWIRELEKARYIEFDEHTSHGNEYYFFLTQRGYKYVIKSLK